MRTVRRSCRAGWCECVGRRLALRRNDLPVGAVHLYDCELAPAAGGGSPTLEIQPSDYFKHLQMGALLEGTIQKGDWGLWTDLVYLNLQSDTSRRREIGLPGGDPLLPVQLALDTTLRTAIWTLAPAYTVLHNDRASLDVMAGLRYSSFRLSLSYEFTAPPTPLQQGGGFWPVKDSTDGLIGVKGAIQLSSDGKWFLPYLADVGDGSENWQWEAFVGAGYHFRWGAITLGVRNLTYQTSGTQFIEKLRFTGPTIAATFRW